MYRCVNKSIDVFTIKLYIENTSCTLYTREIKFIQSTSIVQQQYQATTLWCQATTLASGHNFGVRPQLWCQATTLASGHKFGVRPQLWCQATHLASGHKFGVRPQLRCQATTSVSGHNYSIWSQLQATATVTGHTYRPQQR